MALLQPAEDRYEFGWLDRILDLLAANDIYACIATSTAAQPAWMSQRYPDVLLTGADGVKHKQGGRVNFCPSSPNYRRLSRALAAEMARRYAHHPALVAWHIGNEYGNHCYCDLCAEAFRDWLKAAYGTLEELNRAWNTAFGATTAGLARVETPTANGRARQPAHAAGLRPLPERGHPGMLPGRSTTCSTRPRPMCPSPPI